MPDNTHDARAGKLIDIMASRAGDGVKDFHHSGIMSRQQIRSATQLAKDALEEYLSGAPNERRVQRKLKDALMIFLELEIERQVDDALQNRAVKLLRENVIRRSEKEKLADGLAALTAERFKKLTEDEVEKLADDDTGLLAAVLQRTEIRTKPDDKELNDTYVTIGKLLAVPFLRAFDPAALDTLIKGAARACELAASGKSATEQLAKTVTHTLETIGIIKIMHKSFSGLVLGDLILRQVGKSLGIKEKIHVTDFIIYLGCLIADKQMLPDIEKTELRRVQKELESL